jgi:hypothetical protein
LAVSRLGGPGGFLAGVPVAHREAEPGANRPEEEVRHRVLRVAHPALVEVQGVDPVEPSEEGRA